MIASILFFIKLIISNLIRFYLRIIINLSVSKLKNE